MVVVSEATVVNDDVGAPVRKRACIHLTLVENVPLRGKRRHPRRRSTSCLRERVS